MRCRGGELTIHSAWMRTLSAYVFTMVCLSDDHVVEVLEIVSATSHGAGQRFVRKMANQKYGATYNV